MFSAEKIGNYENKEVMRGKGVMCILTFKENGQEKFVLTSSPEEDFGTFTKAERLREKLAFILVGSEMLSFPGGRVEDGEDVGVSVLREIGEELGVELDDSKLELVDDNLIEIVQMSSGNHENDSRKGMTIYEVACFVYELSLRELIEIEEEMFQQKRSAAVLTLDEISKLREFEIRPSSLEMVQALQQRGEL